MCCIRKKRHCKSQKTVSSHFKKNGGKDDASGGRGFHMSVRQPCMQWEHRNLDGKSEEKRNAQPELD